MRKRGYRLNDLRHASADAGDDIFVLPRPLRRLVRFVVSLATGRIAIPRHFGTVSALAFLAATGLYGMSLGGHTKDVAQATTSAAGFAIENVKVVGNSETSEIDILEALGLDGTTSLVVMDVRSARDRLAKLPWVESVEVRKIYPGTLDVKMVEKKAFGIWQHGEELSLIEKNGSVIAPLKDNKFAELPLFVGRDAETAAASIDNDFSRWPDLRAKVKAFVRVAGRRWDLHLKNDIVIKLPEEGLDNALQQLAALEANQQVFERDIAGIDLRLEDRMAIALTDGAMARRQVALDQRAKMLKKLEKPT